MKLVIKVLYVLFIIMCCTLIIGSLFVRKIYPDVLFEELYFYLFNSVGDFDNSLIIMGVKNCIPIIIFLSSLIYILFDNLFFLSFFVKKNKYRIILKIFLSIILFLVSVYTFMYNLNIIEYIKNNNKSSNFIQNNYVNPKTTNIKFPNKKRNLIMIFVESLETSLFTKSQGGYWDYEVIPELYKILEDEDTTVFYNKNKSELMNQLDTSAWTTGGDVSNTTGLTLKIPIQRSSYYSKDFMSGAYSLGEVLKDNGYYNEYISATRTTFGGIREYFYNHGNYKMIDINSYKNFDLFIEDRDIGNQRFSDKTLFEIAKKRLDVLSSNDEPFNLTLQTIDTHYVDGHLWWYSKDDYNTQYENVYATTSELIYNFIKWVKQQNFYDNTTIMIVGDHISMQADYFESRGAYKRYIYNCYINSAKKTDNVSNRVYSAIDSYPTIISSLGANIEGNKLGLGVDLFSEDNTLSEKYGFDYLNNELNKKSVFYNKIILGKDYEKMKNAKKH